MQDKITITSESEKLGIKMCKECFETLLLSEFYKRETGYRAICKQCYSDKYKENCRLRKLTKEAKVVTNLYHRNVLTKKADWVEKNRARATTRNALISGILVKPSICDLCKSTKEIVAHHKDYSNPFNILWLCKECHIEVHKEDDK